MHDETLIHTIVQLQKEVEALGTKGLRIASAEQLKWFRHTRDSLAEMGAEFLAGKLTELLHQIESANSGAAQLLDLLTTIRVFDRVLTLQTAQEKLRHFEAVQIEKEAR